MTPPSSFIFYRGCGVALTALKRPSVGHTFSPLYVCVYVYVRRARRRVATWLLCGYSDPEAPPARWCVRSPPPPTPLSPKFPFMHIISKTNQT